MARQRRFVAGTRQATDWSRINLTGKVTVAPATKVLVATFALGNPGISETVRRTRGLIAISSDQSAAVEEQIGAFGMMKVNDIALAAGAASIPGPVTDNSDDAWFVWVPFAQRGSLTLAPLSMSYEFDSKAMRTVEEGFGLAVMVENAHAGHTLEFQMSMSLLSSRS